MMQEPGPSLLQSINPLIKLVKQREQLYFELLSFVNRHIQSSSNDLDNLTIFNRFINDLNKKNVVVEAREEELMSHFVGVVAIQVPMEQSITKEMLRFSSRVIEILEASMSKIRKTVFDDSGRVQREFTRFKVMINKILKRQTLNVKEYCQYIISFTAKKYLKQLNKIQKYLEKVEQGHDTCLRDFYCKNTSDHEPHSEEKKLKVEEIPIRRIDFKLEIKQISPQQHHDKKHSVKKTIKPSTKRRERTVHQKNKDKTNHHSPEREEKEEELQRITKEQTANKLLKFYALLELNRKEFMQDYVYEQIQEEKRKQELYQKLIERNKLINNQINSFLRKSCSYLPVPLPAPASSNNKSSGDERNQSSLASRNSLRTSFIISKRKPSFHLETSGNQKNQKIEVQEKKLLQNSVVKNINPRRRSSHSNHRPTAQKSNKKLFVVKPPMLFQDDMIPQAQINQTQWLHMPVTNRYKDRKNENLRLKKKNNVSPMENAMLPDTFRYLM